jgi:Zn-dependent peptidase ImmA (M78 family)
LWSVAVLLGMANLMTLAVANENGVSPVVSGAKRSAALAREVLETYWGSRGFPVDPAWIANRLGIKVVEMTLPPHISGALIKKQDKDPVVLIEKTDSKNRKRFSCAHELGHYFDRLGSSDESYEYVDLRGPASRAGDRPQEVFANSFAAALLMPEGEVRRKVEEGCSLVYLAKYFGVSGEALSYRLSSLGLSALVR